MSPYSFAIYTVLIRHFLNDKIQVKLVIFSDAGSEKRNSEFEQPFINNSFDILKITQY